MNIHARPLVVLSLALTLLGSVAHATEGYLRHPDIHEDKVVFVAEDDVWLAPVAGGLARRLTTHVGVETYPRFSPDGRTIAFTGQYDGNADVYVVSADGGEPTRLTWHPSADIVRDFTPDGKNVVFISSSEQPHESSELFTVPVKGGDAEKLPLGWATSIDMERGGGRWAFTRTPGGGTWKRYRGGEAQTIWVGDPSKHDFKQVTSFAGMSAYPMWNGGRIYYLSDAGGTANLWSMKPDGSDAQRHTDFGNWDARSPSMGPDGRIVFMLAGGVHLFDPTTRKERKLEIDLPSDRVLTRSRYPDAPQSISWFDLAPDADRLALTTRGEIFSVPVKKGVALPVTLGSGARESWATFDPEGKRLIYVTDESREEEIRTIDAWGRGEPKVVLAASASGWHFPPSISPDGKKVAFADQTQTLFVVDLDGGKPTVVDRSEQGPISEYEWSPDGRWLAYTKRQPHDYNSIYIYDTQKKSSHRVTGDDTDDRSPSWDPEGRYLYFLGDRHTNPLLGARDLENVNIEPTRIYLALLRPDVENPFAATAGLPPKDDKEDEKGEDGDDKKDEKKKDEAKSEDKDKDKEKDKKKEPPKPVEIELEGLGDRVVAFPVEPGEYYAVGATKAKVFYISVPMIGMADWGPIFGGGGDPQAKLMSFDLEEKKAKTFMEGVGGYELSAKAGKLAVMKRAGEIYVVGADSPPGDLAESRVDLSGLVIELDPREEWAQIFYESWRQMRDFYWDDGLGGVNWNAVRDQYSSLLPRLASRADLQDLIAETIGELSTSHTYVFGGDPGKQVPFRPTGLLGADLKREGDAFRIERIYRGSPADEERSPLLEPGTNVREGQYILAINHQPFRKDRPFCAHLEGMADKPVLLTVNEKATAAGAREVVVVPLSSEAGVRYADWVRTNREYVAKKTDDKIGYIHVPDMLSAGMIEFNTWFYPQLRKEGMIVDMRWNGGGFVSQMILERFRRPVVSFNRARGGSIDTYPNRTLNGPFVVLTNEFAGSDGDIFPAAVQLEGMAPVIGMRSWGGVVGINSIRPLVDGGLLTQPASAWWDMKQGWDLENRGVVPDIEVQNLPQDLARGIDAQLDRGIREVMRLHAEHPPIKPGFGPARPRGRDAYQRELEQRSASK
jgi:tricorn protease